MTKPINKIKKLWEDKTGVSPIIAVILMVAITVVLAATIYVWVSGFGTTEGGSEDAAVAVKDYTAGGSNGIRCILSKGGDNAPYNVTTDFSIYINGVSIGQSAMTGGVNATEYTWSAGESIIITTGVNTGQQNTVSVEILGDTVYDGEVYVPS